MSAKRIIPKKLGGSGSEYESKTYSPVTVSYKSVKAKLVGVLPSQVAMVETKRSRRDGLEVAAT
jgi:hypothetical protein